jgi:Flp pilus assembly protein TadG
MTMNLNRMLRDTKGAIAVEFALIMPLLCVTLIGIVDFGNYLHEKMTLDALARAGVQYVIQGGNPANVNADIIVPSAAYQKWHLENDPSSYTGTLTCYCASGASVNCNTGSCPAGDYVRSFYTVQINVTYPTILPWTGFPNTIAMQGYARMQYNR